MPRLHSFYAAHMDIDLQIMMYAQDPELTDATGDAFVTTLPKDRGYHAQFLWPELLVPVISTVVAGPNKGFDYITTELRPGKIGSDWQAYARHSSRVDLFPVNGRWRFASHYIIALDMVRQGLGAALVPDFLVEPELTTGGMMLLDEAGMPTLEDYHLCIKESRRSEPALDALMRWFKQELGKTDRGTTQERLRLVQP